MKDLTKKLLCLIAALALVVTLCACGDSGKDDDDDDDKDSSSKGSSVTSEVEDVLEIEGEWEVTFTFAEMLEMSGEDVSSYGMDGMFDAIDAEFTLLFVFEDDGSCAILADPDDMEESYEDMADDILEYLKDGGLYELLEESMGLTQDEVDEVLAEQGYTYDEYCDEYGSTLDMSTALGEFETNDDGMYIMGEDGEYELNDDVLTIDEDELEISYKNGVITIESAEGDAAFMEGHKLIKK